MKNFNRAHAMTWFIAALLSALLAGCGGGDSGGGGSIGPVSVLGGGITGTPVTPGIAGSSGAATTNPTVGFAFPTNSSTNVPTSINSSSNVVTGTSASATFSEAMNPATLTTSSFLLRETASGTLVPGTVTMNASNTTATFKPTAGALSANTGYTAIVTTAATNAAGVPMPNPVAWSFTTGAVRTGQAPVDLGSSATFAVLTKTGVSSVPPSHISGNVGVSPGAGTLIVLACSEMTTGTIYSPDPSGPACKVTNASLLTTAVSDMQTAYTAAAGRTAGVGPFLNVGAGTLTNQTLAPGVYTWGTPVTIPTDLTLNGGSSDVWIFQITGTLDLSAAKRIVLTGGAKANNVFWQVSGAVTTGSTSNFEGTILGQTGITLGNLATANTRLLAQTRVDLDHSTVTLPTP